MTRYTLTRDRSSGRMTFFQGDHSVLITFEGNADNPKIKVIKTGNFTMGLASNILPGQEGLAEEIMRSYTITCVLSRSTSIPIPMDCSHASVKIVLHEGLPALGIAFYERHIRPLRRDTDRVDEGRPLRRIEDRSDQAEDGEVPRGHYERSDDGTLRGEIRERRERERSRERSPTRTRPVRAYSPTSPPVEVIAAPPPVITLPVPEEFIPVTVMQAMLATERAEVKALQQLLMIRRIEPPKVPASKVSWFIKKSEIDTLREEMRTQADLLTRALLPAASPTGLPNMTFPGDSS